MKLLYLNSKTGMLLCLQCSTTQRHCSCKWKNPKSTEHRSLPFSLFKNQKFTFPLKNISVFFCSEWTALPFILNWLKSQNMTIAIYRKVLYNPYISRSCWAAGPKSPPRPPEDRRFQYVTRWKMDFRLGFFRFFFTANFEGLQFCSPLRYKDL